MEPQKFCRKCGHLWEVHYTRNRGDQGCSVHTPSFDPPTGQSRQAISCRCTGYEERADLYRVNLEINFKAAWPDVPAIQGRITDDSTDAPRLLTLATLTDNKTEDERSWRNFVKRLAEITGVVPEY